MNLTIPNVTAEQITSLQQQIAGGGTPTPPQPNQPYDFSAIKSAPSNWAAYTFCSNDEWGQLTNVYGVDAVNQVKNYYAGTYRMPGLVNPGDPGTQLRKTGEKGPCRYYILQDGKQVEDTGQADAVQTKLAGKPGPTLPVRP